jgi:hypothetical protein
MSKHACVCVCVCKDRYIFGSIGSKIDEMLIPNFPCFVFRCIGPGDENMNNMDLHGKWDESSTRGQETYRDEIYSIHETPRDTNRAPEMKNNETLENDQSGYATPEVQRRPSTCSTC